MEISMAALSEWPEQAEKRKRITLLIIGRDEALKKRRNFHDDIASKAAALANQKPSQPTPPPAVVTLRPPPPPKKEVVISQMTQAAAKPVPKPPKKRWCIKVKEIQTTVARFYNKSRKEMLSSRRTADIVRMRMVSMYLSKILTGRSMPDIGRRHGGKDHTTVLSAIRKIARLVGDASISQASDIVAIDIDRALVEQITSIKAELGA